MGISEVTNPRLKVVGITDAAMKFVLIIYLGYSKSIIESERNKYNVLEKKFPIPGGCF